MERRGKKTGIFSNKYEALWKFYEDRHGDYSGEDKHTTYAMDREGWTVVF